MPNNFEFTNFAATTLAVGLSPSATTGTLALGTGAEFPSLSAGQQFAAVITDAATKTVNEVVYVTSITGDVVTMMRGQEYTAARTWLTNDLFIHKVTAGTLQWLAQSPPFSTAEPGYVVFPFGLILQWGTGTFSPSTNLISVELGTPFPNGMLFGVMTDRAGYAYQYGVAAGADNIHISCFCPLMQLENGVIETRTVTATGSWFVGGW